MEFNSPKCCTPAGKFYIQVDCHVHIKNIGDIKACNLYKAADMHLLRLLSTTVLKVTHQDI